MADDDNKTTTETATLGDPPGSLPQQYTVGDPPGTAIDPYVIGDPPTTCPGLGVEPTIAYAGPFVPDYPVVPSPLFLSPLGPQTTLTLGCNHDAAFKRMEEYLTRIETKLDRIEAMINERLAVRDAMQEMLKKVATRKTRKRKMSARKPKVRHARKR
jgi:hypothetical protein